MKELHVHIPAGTTFKRLWELINDYFGRPRFKGDLSNAIRVDIYNTYFVNGQDVIQGCGTCTDMSAVVELESLDIQKQLGKV